MSDCRSSIFDSVPRASRHFKVANVARLSITVSVSGGIVYLRDDMCMCVSYSMPHHLFSRGGSDSSVLITVLLYCSADDTDVL